MNKAKVEAAAAQAHNYLRLAEENQPTPAAGAYALMAIGTLLVAVLEHVADNEL